MSIPKEPRQLMINLMYLVLTAMLALNVSNEILHAFKIINKSMVGSNAAIEGRNNETLLALEANEQMAGQEERVKPFNNKAKEIDAEAKKVYAYLETWKSRIIEQSGGTERVVGVNREGDSVVIKREDNIDATTLLLVERKGGDSVRKVLNDFRQFVLARVNENVRADMEKRLPIQLNDPGKTEDNPSGSWTYGTWHNMPTMAAVTLFAKLQNDVRNSESMALQQLFDEANAKQIKFDAIMPLAVPKNTYVLAGQPVEANIMIAAYNRSVTPEIRPNTGSVTVDRGIGTWKGVASGTGLQTVTGRISLDLGSSKVDTTWKFEYMVGSAGGSIQLDKMNVFYIGVENPITVSAAGYRIEDVSVEVPNCELRATGGGHYMVSPRSPGVINAVVYGTMNNTRKSIQTTPIRIKELPTPRAAVGGIYSGLIRGGTLKNQAGIEAKLEDFVFDARFVVTQYTISSRRKGSSNLSPETTIRSAYFQNEAADIIKNVGIGDRVYLDDIRAIGPDKKERKLGSITLIVN